MTKDEIDDLIARAEPFRGHTLPVTEVGGKNKGATRTYTFTGITNAIGFGSPMTYSISAILTSPDGDDEVASLKSVVEYFESLNA